MLATNSKYIMPIIDNSILIDLIVHFDRAINLIQNSNKYKLVCFNNNNPEKDIILYHLFNLKFPEKSKYEK